MLFRSFFNIFKKDEEYKKVLEHCSYKIGRNHYREILQNNPKLLKDFPNVWDNDKYGGALIEDFDDIVSSSSTMQYLNVVSNLMINFGNLDNLKIVEIGGGYGGQCKIIGDVFKYKQYSIVDLEEVNQLQSKYLSKFSKKNIKFYNFKNYPKDEKYDLLISNYAFSEILEPLQTEYINNILANCKHGYITCNEKIKNFFNKIKI